MTQRRVRGLRALAHTAQEILGESFDPIVELATGADLMPAMVYAQELGAWDYTGMFTAVLRHRVRGTGRARSCRVCQSTARLAARQGLPLLRLGSWAGCAAVSCKQQVVFCIDAIQPIVL